MSALDGSNENEVEFGDIPKDEDLMGSLFISDEGEIRCEASWDWDSGPPAGWETVVVPVALEAGIRQLIRERDIARSQCASWEQTAKELFGAIAAQGLRGLTTAELTSADA